MADGPSSVKRHSGILTDKNLTMIHGVTRRDFVKYSVGTVAGLYLSSALQPGCGGTAKVAEYPIDPSSVVKTTERMLSFPMPAQVTTPNSGSGLCPTELKLVSQYGQYGYGAYTFGAGLPVEKRFDLMPAGYGAALPARLTRLVNFFAMTDIHITDKESPNQLIYLQQGDPAMGGPNTSVYSPVMLTTTQVLDAAVQTINALHQQSPFDFGISLGDVANSTQYNETRWYIDVLDGKVITPSSGAHLGAKTIDYQKPYKAAGLDKSIPWYQAIGNHDRFFLGSVPVDGDPTFNLRGAYTSANVWAIGDLLIPNPANFPCMVDTFAALKQADFYMGVIDGASPTGEIINAGPVASLSSPPTVAADPDRRSLLTAEWIQEFFNTTSNPVGHGFNLVDPAQGSGFACYSFLPQANVPLKVIVLDDVQSATDGSHDIHGHGFLDQARWTWLQAELAAGQAANQLMIIAAHVPIGVCSIGSEMEWWESASDPSATVQNACSLADLVAALQSAPNVLMWIAGHRHVNTVKAFLPPAGGNPENGFWQVETSSLRDFPQQLRMFEIYLNSDYSISIVATNVDVVAAEGSPAATSRAHAIATEQIVQTNLLPNSPNLADLQGAPLPSMDPSRPQDGSIDPTIKYATVTGVPLCASYNAELYKQLSPTMIAALQAQFSAG